jgi:hypothetical protein
MERQASKAHWQDAALFDIQKTDQSYFGLNAAITERFAISQEEAASSCNQSPLELIP